MIVLIVAQVAGDWPMWGGDLTHTGLQLMKGGITTPVVKWRAMAGLSTDWNWSGAKDIDLDGRVEVVVASVHWHIVSFNGDDGTLDWDIRVENGAFRGSPALADLDGDGEVEVVASNWGKYGVFCYDGATGQQEWFFQMMGSTLSPPMIADVDGDGQLEVVVGSNDDKLYCIDASGQREWFFMTGDHVTGAAAIADLNGDGVQEVVFGSYDGYVYCLRGNDGTLIWRSRMDTALRSSPAIADVDADGQLEVVAADRHALVRVMDGATGATEWEHPLDVYWGVYASPSIGNVDDDPALEIFLPVNDQRVYCFDGATGDIQWMHDTGKFLNNPGVLVDIDGDNQLEYILGVQDTLLYCFNARNGQVEWTFTHAGFESSTFSADVDGDGCVELVLGSSSDGSDGYRLHVIDDASDPGGCGTLYQEIGGQIGRSLKLTPFLGGVSLSLSKTQSVVVKVYDVSGKLVKTLISGVIPAGRYFFDLHLKTKGIYKVVAYTEEGVVGTSVVN